ncbi:MAG: SDR family NAD(P)-dependent oxidoreductase, partial [Gemmatimonadales bacterium]
MSTLGPGGRFLEIGKVDILKNTPLALGLLEKNIAFMVIDLAQLLVIRPEFCRSVLEEAIQFFRDGTFKPLPLRVFPVSQAAEAFRYLAQAKHIGKVVISLEEPEAAVMPALDDRSLVRPDGTYLITGGFGGLGLAVAKWMAEQGARHLVLMGRSGPSQAAQAALDAMQAAGAEVVVARADVTRVEEVAAVLGQIDQRMPPLRGVIHAAALLDDGILLQLTPERFARVMAPKIAGAWTLHTLTRDRPLECFVLFSSMASLLGSPGQGNYAAANAFLDALAQHRRAQGLPGLSINWGPWAEVGQAAAQANRGARLALRGLASLTPAQGMQALGRLLRGAPAQGGVMALDLRQWREFYPMAAAAPLLSHLVREEGSRGQPGHGTGDMRAALLAMEPSQRRPWFEG